MQNLERRVSDLEKAQPPARGMTIIRRFVSPGHLNAEIDHISDDAGNKWTRQPDETEKAFTDRAKSETLANPWGIKCLSGQTLRQSHAGH